MSAPREKKEKLYIVQVMSPLLNLWSDVGSHESLEGARRAAENTVSANFRSENIRVVKKIFAFKQKIEAVSFEEEE